MGASAPSSPRRRSMRQIVVINTRWRRRKDGQVVRVVQVHRADRLCEVAADSGSVWLVTFTELRKRYELLVDPDAYLDELAPTGTVLTRREGKPVKDELAPTGRVLRGPSQQPKGASK